MLISLKLIFADFFQECPSFFIFYFFYTGHPLFQGESHDLSYISYSPPSCSSIVSHPFSWPVLINVSAVRRRLTIRKLIIVPGC